MESWEELRAFGFAWWLKNTTSLRLCVERIAKTAFQANQDPMDAALFYLALQKKNVLTHLFRTVNNTRMYEFFREDFNDDRWRRTALKNAFVLMSKQRFQHAAAFFLLAGSLRDALQTVLSRLNDVQLALVVVRLYTTADSNAEHLLDRKQQAQSGEELMREILCREMLGCELEELRRLTDRDESEGSNDDRDAHFMTLSPGASRYSDIKYRP